MASSLRIIVTGLIAQHPRLGGITWHYLQYVIGLARLGHDVYYFEDSGEFPYKLDGGASGSDWIARDCTDNVRALAEAMDRFGYGNRWAYRDPVGFQWFGLSDAERNAVICSADLLIDVSGSLEHPINYRAIPHLLYIDTDPVVTQIKMAQDALFRKRVEAHDTHFSFGASIPGTLADDGYCWRPTRQPIVLSEWRPAAPRHDRLTSVMNWTSYTPLIYRGQSYGQKDEEFRHFLGLPGMVTAAKMEVAMCRIQFLKWHTQREASTVASGRANDDGRPTTLYDLLTTAGWRVVDAIEACGDLDSYRHYIESSKAEWSVAKNAYVVGKPGWFGERSACYLAAGRPVIVQDTGFADTLPVGEGILSFQTMTEAVAAIHDVVGNYRRHAKSARAIAETYFNSDTVLAALIDEAMDIDLSPPHTSRSHAASSPVISASLANNASVPPQSVKTIRTALVEHPAVGALRSLWSSPIELEQIEVLKEQKRKAVYRLIGIGAERSQIIAKRCPHQKAMNERTVYERVLPHIIVTAPHYHGAVAEKNRRVWWLFLEDVGGERFSPEVKEQRSLAAKWLGTMHTVAEGLPVRNLLPKREPDHYLSYLRSVQATIPDLRFLPTLPASGQVVLTNILAMCDFLEAHWRELADFCAPIPRTVIHGDFLAKNIHTRPTRTGVIIAPFDWGGAGWGIAATDLGLSVLPYREWPPTQPDYATYASVIQGKWPYLDVPVVKQLANIGQLFWSLKVISKSLSEFDFEDAHIETLVDKFRVYEVVLANTIRSASWKR